MARTGVRGKFSKSGPRRPAVVARLARTLGPAWLLPCRTSTRLAKDGFAEETAVKRPFPSSHQCRCIPPATQRLSAIASGHTLALSRTVSPARYAHHKRSHAWPPCQLRALHCAGSSEVQSFVGPLRQGPPRSTPALVRSSFKARPAKASSAEREATVARKPETQPRRGLTPRSTGAPTAGHQARAGGTRYIFTGPGLASCRWCPVTSNVRPHKCHRSAPLPKSTLQAWSSSSQSPSTLTTSCEGACTATRHSSTETALPAPRRFVWNPTLKIAGRSRARWACGQAAFEPVHMSTGLLPELKS